MHKWIQHAEKPLGNSKYTVLATQICRSNKFLSNWIRLGFEDVYRYIPLSYLWIYL
jgi:hypothetical protein